MILLAWPVLCALTLLESLCGMWVSTRPRRFARFALCVGCSILLAFGDASLAAHFSVGTFASWMYWSMLGRLCLAPPTIGDDALGTPTGGPTFTLQSLFLVVSLECLLLASPKLLPADVCRLVVLPVGLVGVNIVAIQQALTKGDEWLQLLVVLIVAILLGAGAGLNASSDIRVVGWLTLIGAIHAAWVFRAGRAIRLAVAP